jgi:hypothetical protein
MVLPDIRGPESRRHDAGRPSARERHLGSASDVRILGQHPVHNLPELLEQGADEGLVAGESTTESAGFGIGKAGGDEGSCRLDLPVEHPDPAGKAHSLGLLGIAPIVVESYVDPRLASGLIVPVQGGPIDGSRIPIAHQEADNSVVLTTAPRTDEVMDLAVTIQTQHGVILPCDAGENGTYPPGFTWCQARCRVLCE